MMHQRYVLTVAQKVSTIRSQRKIKLNYVNLLNCIHIILADWLVLKNWAGIVSQLIADPLLVQS